ncbi:hypothetical protein [Flavobacterium sp.]|uniref:hypothetical protein n=1 Tax=Flavobacterium sp. TaxID=239 RepID=UPI00286BF568|nr:hypothetical protein [Flavobacterium sp.]
MRQKPQEKFSIYDIKEGDTLASLATFFEKTQQEIKGFHNIFCEHEELIVFDFPADLKQLYVYPYLHYKAIGVAEHLDESTYLQHKKQDGTRHYNVQYISTEGEKNTVINFEINIIHKGIYTEGHLYLINKITPTTINGENDANDTEEIKEKIGNVAYPLQVLVKENGMWQEVIFDKAIKKRFEITKQEILEYYKGQTTYNMLAHAEERLCNEANFKKMFENNWLLDTVFNNVYKYYNYEHPIKETVKFELLNHVSPIAFDVEQHIGDFEFDSKLITINRKGILNDSRSRASLELAVGETEYDGTVSEKATGKFEQKIILDMKTFNIVSIYLRLSIDLQTPRSVEVKVGMI